MIRIRLVIFLLILEGLLRKGFRPKQWVFWCIVSRESGVSYPVKSVYRIPWNGCIVSRAGVSYPVKWVYRIPCFGVSYPVKMAGRYQACG